MGGEPLNAVRRLAKHHEGVAAAAVLLVLVILARQLVVVKQRAVLVGASFHLLSGAGLLLPLDDRLYEHGIGHGTRKPDLATLRLPNWPTHINRLALADV